MCKVILSFQMKKKRKYVIMMIIFDYLTQSLIVVGVYHVTIARNSTLGPTHCRYFLKLCRPTYYFRTSRFLSPRLRVVKATFLQTLTF